MPQFYCISEQINAAIRDFQNLTDPKLENIMTEHKIKNNSLKFFD